MLLQQEGFFPVPFFRIFSFKYFPRRGRKDNPRTIIILKYLLIKISNILILENYNWPSPDFSATSNQMNCRRRHWKYWEINYKKKSLTEDPVVFLAHPDPTFNHQIVATLVNYRSSVFLNNHILMCFIHKIELKRSMNDPNRWFSKR